MSKDYRQVQKVLLQVLVLNWLVAAAKIFFGLLSRSASMTADGFHSLSDGTSNIIGLIGVRFCSRPKDEDHPYGHKKYETLFALGIAVMLFMVAVRLFKEGFTRFFHPVVPSIDAMSFVVMAVTLMVNIIVMLYESRRGKDLASDILTVDAMHTRADIFTSLSVVVSLVAVKLGFPVVDSIVTILIAGFITHSAYVIVRQESGILCDSVAMDDTRAICDVVLKIDGVKSCHKIRSRGRPDDIHLDLHVQVDGNMRLKD